MLSKLRDALARHIDSDRMCVVTTGSYARRDASEMSDLDYILINHLAASDQECAQAHSAISELLVENGIRQPSTEGAFGETVTIPQLTTNIGGKNDSNEALTWRMLLLLE